MLGQPVGLVFCVIALGKLLGSAHVRGLSLGTSGIIFVALAFGAWGYVAPALIGDLGLVLFAYAIGLSAGATFFRAFAAQGVRLSLLALMTLAVGALLTLATARLFDVPSGVAVGIFAGAMTSTPGLAAALEHAADPAIGIGYGIAYPLGVIAVVLFVQVMARRKNRIAGDTDTGKSRRGQLEQRLVEIRNPAVAGRRIPDIPFLTHVRGQISRVVDNGVLVPVDDETELAVGQKVVLLSAGEDLENLVDFLGETVKPAGMLDTQLPSARIVVTASDWVGRSLLELRLPNRFGAAVSRIVRHDVAFVPTLSTTLQTGDLIEVVGKPSAFDDLRHAAGHRDRFLHETDMLGVALGIALGVALGKMTVSGFGGSLQLGLAGGPLVTGMLFAHWGGTRSVRAHVPQAARSLMLEIGLSLFLASAGLNAGGHLLDVLRDHGWKLVPMSFIVASVPILVAYAVARRCLGLSRLETLGGICGGMTSSPGLASLTQETDDPAPVVSYTAAYPVALIGITFLIRVLIKAFGV